jgi:hypothetical protein
MTTTNKWIFADDSITNTHKEIFQQLPIFHGNTITLQKFETNDECYMGGITTAAYSFYWTVTLSVIKTLRYNDIIKQIKKNNTLHNTHIIENCQWLNGILSEDYYAFIRDVIFPVAYTTDLFVLNRTEQSQDDTISSVSVYFTNPKSPKTYEHMKVYNATWGY